MSRTNIDLDDDLVRQAMTRYRVRTKREAVDRALREALGVPLTLDEALAMQGSGWDADLNSMRSPDLPWS